MTYSHEETQARLLDLVYGEAAPTERADLEAHVAGCARCRAELAALGGTRARVRAALVEEPAPVGVHARLLREAAAAVAPAPRARAAAAAVAPSPRARVVAPSDAPSLWQKLRQGWTVPTFATVGAFAILLLASKVFLNPQRTYERGHEGIVPRAPEPAASARDVESQPSAANGPTDKVAAAPEAKAEVERSREDAARRLGVVAAHERASAKASEKSMRHDVDAEGAAGLLGKETAQEAFGGGEWRHKGGGGAVPGLGNLRGPSGPRERGGVGVGSGAASLGAVGGKRGAGAPAPSARVADEPLANDTFARPPAGWQGGAPAAAPASPAPPPRAPAPSKKAVADDLDRASASLEEEDEAPSRAKAEKVAPEPSPVEKKKSVQPPVAAKPQPAPEAPRAAASATAPAAQAAAKDMAPKAAPPRESPARESSDAKEDGAAPTQEALARRAEKLFVARRWDEAVAAYRELLRRFPDADPAAKWRGRLAQAERESAEVTASRAAAKSAPKEETKAASKKAAKKATSDEPLEGL